MRSIRLPVLSVAVAVGLIGALTGCTPPDDTDASVTTSATPTRPTPSATPTPTPTPTVRPTPTSTPVAPEEPQADGTDPEPSDEWTLQLAYDACAAAPDADAANPIVTYGALSESRVDQSGPGVWLVVIPVTRSANGTETGGQQVCFIDGSPDAPNIAVATSL